MGENRRPCSCLTCRVVRGVEEATFSDQLPSLDEVFAFVEDKVLEDGCGILCVDGLVHTLGMSVTLDHPELVVVGGMDESQFMTFLSVVDRVGSRDLQAYDHSMILERDTRLLFRGVPNDVRGNLVYLSDYYERKQRPFDALQVVFPDAHNRLPGDFGFADNRQSWRTWERSRRAAVN